MVATTPVAVLMVTSLVFAGDPPFEFTARSSPDGEKDIELIWVENGAPVSRGPICSARS